MSESWDVGAAARPSEAQRAQEPQTLVSIIVPAFNAGSFLAGALDRLLEQSHQHIEIVVVDDGSSDDTGAIAGRYAAASTRVIAVSLPGNQGVARARETAVLASSGKYLWFVDADDQWSVDAVLVMLRAAVTTGADVVVAGAVYVLPDHSVKPVGSVLGDRQLSAVEAFRLFLTGSITGHLWNKLVSSAVARSIDFTPAKVHSDQAMVAQLLGGATSIVTIDEGVYRYVLRQGSIIRSGTPRLESITLVADAVEAAARRLEPGLLGGDEYAYYRTWFFALSAVKDATSGAYSPERAAQHLRVARRHISLGALLLLARRRDLKKLVVASAAKFSIPLYRLIMSSGTARG